MAQLLGVLLDFCIYFLFVAAVASFVRKKNKPYPLLEALVASGILTLIAWLTRPQNLPAVIALSEQWHEEVGDFGTWGIIAAVFAALVWSQGVKGVRELEQEALERRRHAAIEENAQADASARQEEL